MRINIDIDDTLMRQAMRLGKAGTKKATVEAALRLFVQTHMQGGIRKLHGKVKFERETLSSPAAGASPAGKRYTAPGR